MRRSVIHNWMTGLVMLGVLAGFQPRLHAEKVLYVQTGFLRDTATMIGILEAQGHDLTVLDTEGGDSVEVAEFYATNGFDLLICDEVISSGDVGNRWRHSTVPVINWEGFLYNDPRSDFNAGAAGSNMTATNGGNATAAEHDAYAGGLGSDYGQATDQTNINIIDANHPLSAGLGAGLVGVFAPTNGWITFAGSRTMVSGIDVVATVPGFDEGWCVFGVPVGVINGDGTTNQAKWVHLPWNTSEEARVLTDNSFFLFEAAVAWALDKSEPTKIRNLTPASGSGLPTNTVVSFSVDQVTAAGSAVSTNGIDLKVDGVSVIDDAVISDGGSTWDVTYSGGLPENQAVTLVAEATAADGGFSARQASVDTIEVGDLFSFEAEDFNFDGGNYIDNPLLCDDPTYAYPPPNGDCYWNRVGITNIDELELNGVVVEEIPSSNEVYRFGDPGDFARDEWVDTYITDDSLIRTQYTAAGVFDYEVRNIAVGEWLNYTRTFPTGNFHFFMRVDTPTALQADLAFVTGATTTNQTVESKGKFVTAGGTGGYTYVQLTDGAGVTPIVVSFDGTPTTVRITAESAGWEPNYYYLLPTTNLPNAAPVASITSPTNYTVTTGGATISVDVTASDSDGSITNVQVFAGTSEPLALVGQDNTAPYNVSWMPSSAELVSTYVVRAVATDNGGLTAQDEVNVRLIDPNAAVATTADGVGGDADVSENDDGDTGNGVRENMNARINPPNRNEVIVMKFDFGTNSLAGATDAALNLVSWRGLDAADLRVYAVQNGTAGLDNNGVTPGYTDNTWDQTAQVQYSTTPGLVWDGDSDSPKVFTNVVDLGVQSLSVGEGDLWSFSSVALLNFLQTNSDSIIMLLIDCETEASGQKRFATREANTLNSGDPIVQTGWYAPYLAVEIGGNIAPEVTITSPTEGATLDGGVEVIIEATASDDDGTVAGVDFYAGISEPLAFLGTDTTVPYTQAWTPTAPDPANAYIIRAVATDNNAESTTNSINVTVVDPSLTVVSTAVGDGADTEMREQDDPSASRNDATDLNTRFTASDRNEVVGLKFDLTGLTLSELNNVAINLINYRTNSTRVIDIYGVTQGAFGGSGAYSTETWTDSGGSTVQAWGDLPGLLTSDGNVATESLDLANLTLLVDGFTITSLAEGSVEQATSAALTSFVQNYSGSSLITFLITAGNTSGGQFRFASKEATQTASGVLSGSAGDLAPYLSFTIGAAEPELEFVVTGGGTGIDFSWTGAFKLQSQTNSLGTGLSTNWFDYPGGGGSPVSVPVDPSQPTVFFRLAPQ